MVSLLISGCFHDVGFYNSLSSEYPEGCKDGPLGYLRSRGGLYSDRIGLLYGNKTENTQ